MFGILLLPSLISAQTNPEDKVDGFELPVNARKVSDTLFYLGYARDVDGRLVEGYAHIYKKGNVKPPQNPKGGPTCYGFLSRGAMWKDIEPYIVNPTNNSAMAPNFVSQTLGVYINQWEDAADGVLNGSGLPILGDEIAGTVDGADTVTPDNKNEVYFDGLDSGTIGVTIVWGIFGGPPQGRELVEWDQVYNDVDFDWSQDASSDPSKMDFANIANHELGHTFGLDDIYDGTCTEVTMYGYATEGEINKRDLTPADVMGISSLY